MQFKPLLTVLYIILGALALYLLFKYALPWTAPFIAAFIVSRIAHPLAERLEKRYKWRRALASALSVTLVLALLVTAAALVVGRVVIELSELSGDIPKLVGQISALYESLETKIAQVSGGLPEGLAVLSENLMSGLSGATLDLIGTLSVKILSALSGTAKSAPGFFMFLITAVCSSYFFSASHKEVRAFVSKLIPSRHRAIFSAVNAELRSALGRWGKAQGILTAVTFGLLTVLFLILRIEYAVVLALAVAFIDLFPVIGVGTVLLPWSGVCLIGGNGLRALILFLGFLVIICVRNVLEMRLVGAKLGLHPLAATIAMYIGLKCGGIIGMTLFPFALLILKRLSDRGLIRLTVNN